MAVLTPATVYAPGRNPPKSEIIQLLEQLATGTAGIGDYQGVWDNGVVYVAKDYVQYGGSIWYAKRENQGVTPVEGDDWTELLPGATVADGAISTPKLADEAVTIAKIAEALLSRIDASRASQGRARLDYWTSSSVAIFVPDAIAMNGFRLFGNNTKSGQPVFSTGGAGRKVVSIIDDIAFETQAALSNWYAVFAVANDGDPSASFVCVPFFRVFGVASNVVTLAAGGENTNVTPATKTYNMANDVLIGADCFVINEGSNWSGRVAEITDNTNGTITLDDADTLAQLNYLLPAPVGWDHYQYLASFYHEPGGSAIGGDIRNIADTGAKAMSRGVTVSEFPASGTITNQKVRLGGMIPPLAAAVICSPGGTISTASLGTVTLQLRHDSSDHDVFRTIVYKEAAANMGFNQMAEVSFSKEQAFWVTTAGTLSAAVVSITCLVYGWIEP